jgi:ketosteroid isomerase-like protein
MTKFGLLIALATFAMVASPVRAEEACPPADDAKVASTMERFLAALGDVDEPALKSLLAPDFVAFDSGRRYAGTQLQEMVAGIRRSGTTVKLTMTEPQVHVRCGLAWVTYVNKGALTKGDTVRALSWLESAVLSWDDGAWRMKFMHATEVAK